MASNYRIGDYQREVGAGPTKLVLTGDPLVLLVTALLGVGVTFAEPAIGEPMDL